MLIEIGFVCLVLGLLAGWYIGDFVGSYLVEWYETVTANGRVAADKDRNGSSSNKEFSN